MKLKKSSLFYVGKKFWQGKLYQYLSDVEISRGFGGVSMSESPHIVVLFMKNITRNTGATCVVISEHALDNTIMQDMKSGIDLFISLAQLACPQQHMLVIEDLAKLNDSEREYVREHQIPCVRPDIEGEEALRIVRLMAEPFTHAQRDHGREEGFLLR